MATNRWKMWLKRRPVGASRVKLHSPTARPSIEYLEDRRLLATFMVTNTADGGPGSLRQAILDADGNPNPPGAVDQIQFNISGSGRRSIQPLSALPNITDPVLIDGTTQPGFAGSPLVELDGELAGTDVTGLTFTTGFVDSTLQQPISGVKGLLIDRFSANGISLLTSGSNLVQSNLIGVENPAAAHIGNGGDGIHISTSGNIIGGTATGDGNVISDNGANGILLFAESESTAPTGNVIQGNLIGMDPAGTSGLGNQVGINLGAGSQNTVGGPIVSARNIISGNGTQIIISDAGGELVQGNFIGADIHGDSGVALAVAGLMIDNSPNNVIGGTEPGAGNLISGNESGLVVSGSMATGNLIQGNLIGTDASGTFRVENSLDGVVFQNSAANNTVGGTTPGARNVISGNGERGIQGLSSSTGNTIEGNFIGTDRSGLAALGNLNGGISLFDSTNYVIGGTQTGAGNVISGNGSVGVIVDGDSSGPSTGNIIEGNKIGTDPSGTFAIANVGGIGVLVFDATNTLIGGAEVGAGNVISGNDRWGVQVTDMSSTTQIQGNLIGTGANGSTVISNGQGGVLIEGSNNTVGGPTAAARNIISRNLGHGVSLSGPMATNNTIQGNYIGTDTTGSANLGNAGNGILISTSNGIVDTNDLIAGNVIVGNNLNGISITNCNSNTIQGNFVGTAADGTHPLPNVETGISIFDGRNNIVGGTTPTERNVISGNEGTGIGIGGISSTNNQVTGNYVGTDVNGTTSVANGAGILILADASSNVIGGTQPGTGNVISGNTNDGVDIQLRDSSFGPIDNTIQGNLIGTTAEGRSALGNLGDGINIESSGNTVGGMTLGARNVISGNGINGVHLSQPTASGNLVAGNFIGLDGAGDAVVGNSQEGVRIDHGPNNTVLENVISGNDFSGVAIIGSSGNTVLDNTIGANPTGLVAMGNHDGGIDIVASGNAVSGNLLSGNGGIGVLIRSNGGTSANGNVVYGNLIGTDANGGAAVGNGVGGVLILDASNNVIGGSTARSGNVISGNGGYGVQIETMSGTATGNVIQGNMIGTDITATQRLGNGLHGVLLNGVSNNIVGGTTDAVRNIVSGNMADGIRLTNNAANNIIQGNYVGTDRTGSRALANTQDGVFVEDSPGNSVGGTSAGTGNLISGNGNEGVHFSGAQSHDNVVDGNLIGTQADGTNSLRNGFDGVLLENASDNLIGGLAPGAGNIIAFNARTGVAIGSSAADMSTGDAVLSNTIFSNGRLGIDLGNDGVTPNHPTSPTTGPNNFQNSPVLTSISFTSDMTTIAGTLDSVASSTFRIEFFTSFGEGKTLLGGITVMTDGMGRASFIFTSMPAVPIGQNVTATSTLLVGTQSLPRDTSEFSAAIQVGTHNQRFVAQIYRDLLHREVDSTGLANFTAFLDAGGPRSSVAAAILASPEYQTLLVEDLYQRYLHRSADPSGLSAFVSFLSHGGTVEQAESVIVASAEYLQNRGGGTNSGFLSVLYQDALNRPIDPLGDANFTLLLMQGGTRGELADAVFTSPEYRGDLVESLYSRFLGRTADSGGLIDDVGFLQQGGRDEQLITALTASDEYFSRV